MTVTSREESNDVVALSPSLSVEVADTDNVKSTSES